MADEIKQDEGREVPPDPFPGLTERISALTPEDMLDTGAEDQRREENFHFAARLHADALARREKTAIELDRLAKQEAQARGPRTDR
jgi:hypothetical protein